MAKHSKRQRVAIRECEHPVRNAYPRSADDAAGVSNVNGHAARRTSVQRVAGTAHARARSAARSARACDNHKTSVSERRRTMHALRGGRMGRRCWVCLLRHSSRCCSVGRRRFRSKATLCSKRVGCTMHVYGMCYGDGMYYGMYYACSYLQACAATV